MKIQTKCHQSYFSGSHVVQIIAALAVVSAMIRASFAADNLVAGGAFEDVPVGCGTDCHSSCLPSVPGWLASLGYSVDRITYDAHCTTGSLGPWNPVNAAGGHYMISLQGSVCCGCNNNGWIKQTVPTIAGHRYALTFDVALDRSDVLRLTLGAAVRILAGTIASEAAGWAGQRIEFVATGATLVRFASESPTSSTPNNFGGCWEGEGALLDNVAVVEITEPTCLDADLFRDGQINGADLGALLTQWGPANAGTVSDINHDGRVDGADLSFLLVNWGPCPN